MYTEYNLTDDEILQNENFFLHLLSNMKEGGRFIYKSAHDFLIKRGRQFVVSSDVTYHEIKSAVSADFFEKHFVFWQE